MSTTERGSGQPATLNACLHVHPDQVAVTDLTDERCRDLVSLKLGDSYSSVAVLGTLDEVMDILAAAMAAAVAVRLQRKAADR